MGGSVRPNETTWPLPKEEPLIYIYIYQRPTFGRWHYITVSLESQFYELRSTPLYTLCTYIYIVTILFSIRPYVLLEITRGGRVLRIIAYFKLPSVL